MREADRDRDLAGGRPAVTANVYSHVIADERELDYAELLAA